MKRESPVPKSLIEARSSLKKPVVLIPVLLAIAIGSIYLITRASGLAFSFEPENGTLAGTATVGNDGNASGGKYVQFGSAAGPTTPPPTPLAGSPCGAGGSAPAQYDHVIWINFENYSYTQVQNDSRLSYTHSLEQKCGLATNFFSENDPSEPNYIAEVAGTIAGQTSDAAPSNPGSNPADNLFNEVKLAGKQWRTYAESMPSNCYAKDYPPSPNALYTVHHEAAPYFSDIAGDCKNWDVPLGTTTSGAFLNDVNNNTLPAFAVIGPNDDGGCSKCGGDVDPIKLDGFLQKWMPLILNSQAYKAGKTAVFITWDEDSTFGGASEKPFSNHVATIVIAPSVPTGAQSATMFTHYSMLRSTEEMLGISKLLGGAATANDMRGAFHL